MTTIINASTSAGLVNTADNSGILALQTNGTTAVTIDASQNVGIGTASPESFGGGHKSLELSGSTNTEGGVFKTATSGSAGSGSTGTEMLMFTDSVGGKMNVVSSHPAIFYTANAERMRIDSSGSLLVGITATSGNGGIAVLPDFDDGAARLIFNRASTAASSIVIKFDNAGTAVGTIAYTNTATTYATSSDYRLKNTIAPMTGALAKVALLKPCTYKWNVDGSDGQGFIAHELAEVEAGCVNGEKDAVDSNGNPVYQGVDTSFLVATLTAAIQEQQALITQLQADVAELKGAQQ